MESFFADDTNVFLDGYDLKELVDELNSELQKLYIWLISNKLTLNLNKTPFSLNNGVKQEGVPFPILFSIYIDSLLQKLNDSGLGCHVGRTFSTAFGYADDLVLISPSLSGLRRMIQICEQYAIEYSIVFNPVKSRLMCFNSVSPDKPYISDCR